MKKLFLVLVLFVTSLVLKAQGLDIGTWNILNLRYSINQKWSVFGEGQIRSLKLYNQFHYYEYKGGFNYKANNNLMLSLAAGSYQTYKEGGNFLKPKNNDEFRIWPQVLLTQSLGSFKIEQRYRAELRFTSNGYRNRFRYRFGVSYPFGSSASLSKPWQLYLNNEIFLTDGEPFFERNRMALGLQYKTSATTTLQLGFLHQFDYKINDETGRDFIQIGYFFELHRRDHRP
jgi:long-subunit fatty acid transport protein